MGEIIEHILFSLVDKNRGEIEIGSTTSNVLSNLSYLPKDNTDRNRTSPFAFTGNKFEFRMLGSSVSGSLSATVISTILAETLKEIADRLEPIKYLQDVREEALKIVTEIIAEHGRVLFSGNGYSDEWVAEAEKRGLPNVRSFVESVEYLNADKSVKLFESNGIFNKAELDARAEVLYEIYAKTMQVEAKTMLRMTEKVIVTAELDYLGMLASMKGIKLADKKFAELETTLDNIVAKVANVKKVLADLAADHDLKSESVKHRTILLPALNDLRLDVDMVEELLPEDAYPIPTYTDMWWRQD